MLTRPATLPGPWIDQSFLFLTLPGLLVSSVGSTVLGIALLRNHFRPRVAPWPLVLWIPLLLAITQITSMGNAVLPAIWAWAIAIRSTGSLDPSSSRRVSQPGGVTADGTTLAGPNDPGAATGGQSQGSVRHDWQPSARWAIARSVDREERGRRGAAGAKVTIIAAKNAPPDQAKKAPDFTLDLVKGGWIGLKDLAGKPFVLAFFMSCPDSRSPSPMNRLRWSSSFGLAELLGFVFVRSDGTVAASYDRAPTK